MRNDLTALAALLVSLVLVGAGCRTRVPDVTGQTEAEAAETLADAGLEVGVVSQMSADADPGTIVKQDPEGGANLPEDGKVAIFVTPGGASPESQSQIVKVPQLVGGTVETALPLLTDAGLVLGAQTAELHEGPPNVIFDQDPFDGAEVERGTAVNVRVASETMVAVPPLIGTPRPEAEQRLRDAELAVGAVEMRVDAGGVPVGAVLDMNPSPGLRVATGSPVRLIVRQESTRVPRVFNKASQAAQLDVFRAHLSPVVRCVVAPTRVGRVVTQSPSANTLVARESYVFLEIGRRTKRECLPRAKLWQKVTEAGKGTALTQFELQIFKPGGSF